MALVVSKLVYTCSVLICGAFALASFLQTGRRDRFYTTGEHRHRYSSMIRCSVFHRRRKSALTRDETVRLRGCGGSATCLVGSRFSLPPALPNPPHQPSSCLFSLSLSRSLSLSLVLSPVSASSGITKRRTCGPSSSLSGEILVLISTKLPAV